MSSAGFALQKAIFEKLTSDAPTLAALGGPRVYDDAPARTEFPFVTFGQSSERDWSTGSDEGYEHLVTLHVWSRARGRRYDPTRCRARHGGNGGHPSTVPCRRSP